MLGHKMGLIIDITKIEADGEQAICFFLPFINGLTGKVAIKKSAETFTLGKPEFDKESELAGRVCRVLIRHWKKNKFPEITGWFS